MAEDMSEVSHYVSGSDDSVEDFGIPEDTRLFRKSFWDEFGKEPQEEPFCQYNEEYFWRDTFRPRNDCINGRKLRLFGGMENLDYFAEEEWVADAARLAVEKYNDYNDEPYEFVRVENVNGSCCAGFMLYIAMKVQKANDSSESDDSRDGGEAASETFHAIVYSGIGKNQVLLVRHQPKKTRP